MNPRDIASTVLAGNVLSDAAIAALAAAGPDELPEMLAGARRICRARFGDRAAFCAIVNAKSGRCSEDCAFCAQSSRHRTDAPEYPLLAVEAVLEAAERAERAGAGRLGVVVSGKGLTGAEFDRAVTMVSHLRSRGGIAPDLSPGILEPGQFVRLKAAGLGAYHHNLETSRRFFPTICRTHAYDEDVAAVRAARAAGLEVCCGGIFGLGEDWEDRVELALTLKSLGVRSVPINFLTPIPGTRLEGRPVLSPAEALKIAALYRYLLPEAHIRICGGRSTVFAPKDRLAPLEAGASALMVGDYLTTPGADVAADRDGLARLGLVLASEADDAWGD